MTAHPGSVAARGPHCCPATAESVSQPDVGSSTDNSGYSAERLRAGNCAQLQDGTLRGSRIVPFVRFLALPNEHIERCSGRETPAGRIAGASKKSETDEVWDGPTDLDRLAKEALMFLEDPRFDLEDLLIFIVDNAEVLLPIIESFQSAEDGRCHCEEECFPGASRR